jgi:PAS domain S-box-containing protein
MIRWVFIKGIPRLNTEGNLRSALCIVEDISDRKNNENIIAKIENNLRAIIENAQAGYLLLDNDFLVLEFNNRMSTYFEITEKILLKKNGNILKDLSKQGQDSFSKMIKAVYAGGNLNFEISTFLSDGTPINLKSKIYPITNKDNKVTGACLYYEDITDRKIVEKNIQELNNSLDKKVLERTMQYDILNKELEAFTFSVSHDLRAPLRAVIGYAEILEEEQIKVLNDEGKKMLSNIKNNGKKMGRLIDDLLAFSKLGRKEINKSQLNMNELTKAVVEELNRVFPNHAEITIGGLPNVDGDYNLIYQVMFNLIGNSIKYSSKKERPQISIYSEQKDDKNIYIIKDNGAGFDMRFVEKLFGVFQRLHSEQEFEGNGVGLAIVQRIIHKHGGKIWGEGKENEGACFYFTLN